jgi:hypothetical protein
MKIILLSICAFTLLSTSGCIVADGRRHRHEEVFVPVVPVVVVHPAVVHVRVE